MQANSSDRVPNNTPQMDKVSSTSTGLIKATLGAAAVAGAILTFIWLPAEHGVDPTGVGHILGLTEMGHIKEQLHVEADVDALTALTTNNVTSTTSEAEINQRLEVIQVQLATMNGKLDSLSVLSQLNSQNSLGQLAKESATGPSATPIAIWRDEVSYTLLPGEGIEVKLAMLEGASAEFEWSANGAVLNHDTHGDGTGQSISYEKGRSVPGQADQITAAFTGNHGWFWRNRTNDDVVLTIRTRGEYEKLVLP